MQFRKLFTADNERALRPRQRLGAEYIEGRGLYPEQRAGIADRPESAVQYENRASQSRAPQSDYNGRWDSDRVAGRRRMPLTTLEALVQIKANALTQDNA